MRRREVKEKHEKAVLQSFKKLYAQQSKDIKFTSYPEPPDAIVEIDGNETWIEITDAFLKKEWAESLTSASAEDKEHKKVTNNFIVEPKQEYSEELKKVILKKYTKSSIGKVYKEFGQGILLVGIYTPFEAIETIPDLIEREKKNILSMISSHEQRFKKIYFYIGEHHFFEFISI
jgi:hypothetical protein